MSVNTVKTSGTPIALTFNPSLDISATEYTIIQKFENIIILQLFCTVSVINNEIPALTTIATIPNNALPVTVVNANGIVRNDYYNNGIYTPVAFRIGRDGAISCRLDLTPAPNPSWNIMLSIAYITN